jgi:hypothetical protein
MTRGTSHVPSRFRSAVAPCSLVVVGASAWLTPDRCTPSRLNFEALEGLSLISAGWVAISPFRDTGESTGRPPVSSGTYPREPTGARSSSKAAFSARQAWGIPPSAQSRRWSGLVAGPSITSPVASKRDPWQGQSQVFSGRLNLTMQPRRCSAPRECGACPSRLDTRRVARDRGRSPCPLPARGPQPTLGP